MHLFVKHAVFNLGFMKNLKLSRIYDTLMSLFPSVLQIVPILHNITDNTHTHTLYRCYSILISHIGIIYIVVCEMNLDRLGTS